MPDKRVKHGGRKEGKLNKVTEEVQTLAKDYGPRAIARLWAVADNKKTPPAAVISACNSLLDRGYGKPPQYSEQLVIRDETVDSDVNLMETARRLAFLLTEAAQPPTLN